MSERRSAESAGTPVASPARVSLLSVFNRYSEIGGEEAGVEGIAALLSREYTFEQIFFDSRDWTGKSAPSTAMQALLSLYNPSSLRRVRSCHRIGGADAWLLHNVMPVGSAAIYREAVRQKVPVINYIHNFRPFSVNGYLWADNAPATGGLRKNYWKEIRHGAWQNSRIKTAWYAFVLTLMHRLGWFRCIKSWIAISEFMRQKFIEAGVPAADIFTIPYSFDPLPNAPVPHDDGYYLFLGRLIEAKGVRILFDTWDILHERLGDRTPHLRIAGDGPLAAWVRDSAAERAYVHYCGRVSGEEKADLLRCCRGMLAPSLWWESLGLVTYEAYDNAKPMLAARSGGLTETVQHGQTGLLHEAGNAAELASQVEALEGDARRRVEMGQAGRAWLLEHAGHKEWTRKFRSAVDHAIGRGGVRR